MKLHGFVVVGLAFAGGSVAVDQRDETRVRQAIATLAPDAKVESFRPSAMPGVFEAVVGGNEVYVSADGKFLLTGTLWDVSAGKNL